MISIDQERSAPSRLMSETRNDSTSTLRMRNAELSWVPYIIVFGERELKSEKLSVRTRKDGKEIKTSLPELVSRIKSETQGYPSRELTYPKLMSQRPGYKRN